MPSATIKSDSSVATDSHDCLQRLSQSIEKKIRNLDKRKNKLEYYQQELDEGKDLNADQCKAVEAYDGVVAALEMCREINSQVDVFIEENAKLAKIQRRKQIKDRSRYELERIKQLLKYQDVFSRLSRKKVQDDFISGSNGAVQVSQEKLHHLQELNKLITPALGAQSIGWINSPKVKTYTSEAAEHLVCLMDGKNKMKEGFNYREMRALVTQISSCPYQRNQESSSSDQSSGPSPTMGVSQRQSSSKTKKSKPPKVKDNDKSVSNEPVNVVEAKSENLTSSSTSASLAAEPPASNQRTIHPPKVASASADAKRMNGIPNEATLASISPSLNKDPIQPSQNRMDLGIGQNESLFYGNSLSSRTLARGPVDIADLMASGSFNFLQDSQVSSNEAAQQAAVYLDPAVVSFGSVKPDGLVQMHEQQQKQLAHPPPPPPPSHFAPPPPSPPKQFTGPSHSPPRSFAPATYSVPPPTSSAPPPNPLSDSSPADTFDRAAPTPPKPSSSWATQEESDGWGSLDNAAEIEVDTWSANSFAAPAEPHHQRPVMDDYRKFGGGRGRGNVFVNRGNSGGSFHRGGGIGRSGGYGGHFQSGSRSSYGSGSSFRGGRGASNGLDRDRGNGFRGGRGGWADNRRGGRGESFSRSGGPPRGVRGNGFQPNPPMGKSMFQ